MWSVAYLFTLVTQYTSILARWYIPCIAATSNLRSSIRVRSTKARRAIFRRKSLIFCSTMSWGQPWNPISATMSEQEVYVTSLVFPKVHGKYANHTSTRSWAHTDSRRDSTPSFAIFRSLALVIPWTGCANGIPRPSVILM